jgi:hypothetical protein
MLSSKTTGPKSSADDHSLKLREADESLNRSKQCEDPGQEFPAIIVSTALLDEYRKRRQRDRKYIKRCS